MSAVRRARTVVITEASSPVGMATARRLAAGGHSVLMGSRRPQLCEEFAAPLRCGGAAVFAAHLDLADPLSIGGFLESVDYLVGDADTLISTAGVIERSWVGAQHLVTQLVTPMVEGGHGDVVLLGPELVGAPRAEADRMLEAWVSGLDAEFVGTGVRAAIVRASGAAPPDDAACLIATAICSADDTCLRLIEVIRARGEGASIDGAARKMHR